MPTCENCGSHVSEQYARVFAPPGATDPRVCPWCPDKIRDGQGGVREANARRRVDE